MRKLPRWFTFEFHTLKSQDRLSFATWQTTVRLSCSPDDSLQVWTRRGVCSSLQNTAPCWLHRRMVISHSSCVNEDTEVDSGKYQRENPGTNQNVVAHSQRTHKLDPTQPYAGKGRIHTCLLPRLLTGNQPISTPPGAGGWFSAARLWRNNPCPICLESLPSVHVLKSPLLGGLEHFLRHCPETAKLYRSRLAPQSWTREGPRGRAAVIESIKAIKAQQDKTRRNIWSELDPGMFHKAINLQVRRSRSRGPVGSGLTRGVGRALHVLHGGTRCRLLMPSRWQMNPGFRPILGLDP